MLNIKLLKQHHQFQSNTYLLCSAGMCAVVDPSVPFDESIVEGKLEYIILTHAHFDHMLDIDSWVAHTDAVVLVSAHEVDALSDPIRNCYKFFNGSDRGYFGKAQGLVDGDIIPLGDVKIKAIHAPGHTSGSLVYLVENYALVGDSVFAGGGYGRTDLPTGNISMLKSSIDKIISLPEDTILLPGHGPATTVKEYKQDIGR